MKKIVLFLVFALMLASLSAQTLSKAAGFKSEGLTTVQLNALPLSQKIGLTIRDITLGYVVTYDENTGQFVQAGGGSADGVITNVALNASNELVFTGADGGYNGLVNMDRFALDTDFSNYRLLTNNTFTGTVTATSQFRVNGGVNGYAALYGGSLQITSTDDTQTWNIGNREGIDVSNRIGIRAKANWNEGLLEFDYGTDDRYEIDGSPILTAANANSLGFAPDGTGTDDQTLAEVLTQGNNAGNQSIIGLGNITPDGNGTRDLGSTTLPWLNGYINTLRFSGGLGSSISLTGSLALDTYLDFQPTDTQPSDLKGREYFDDSENRKKVFDGTSWKTVVLDGDVTGTDDQTAAEVAYDPSTSSLNDTNLQDAVDALDVKLEANISNVEQLNTTQQLILANVAENKTRIDSVVTAIAGSQTTLMNRNVVTANYNFVLSDIENEKVVVLNYDNEEATIEAGIFPTGAILRIKNSHLSTGEARVIEGTDVDIVDYTDGFIIDNNGYATIACDDCDVTPEIWSTYDRSSLTDYNSFVNLYTNLDAANPDNETNAGTNWTGSGGPNTLSSAIRASNGSFSLRWNAGGLANGSNQLISYSSGYAANTPLTVELDVWVESGTFDIKLTDLNSTDDSATNLTSTGSWQTITLNSSGISNGEVRIRIEKVGADATAVIFIDNIRMSQ